MRVSKNFVLQEFVPEHVWKKHGEKSIRFLRPSCFITAQKLRDIFGKLYINTWHFGGSRNWSGLRTPKYKKFYKYSLHNFGGATDKLFDDYSSAEVIDYILKNPDKFPEVNRIETGVSWVHTDDMYNPSGERILTFTK